jgi:hypothetical protein
MSAERGENGRRGSAEPSEAAAERLDISWNTVRRAESAPSDEKGEGMLLAAN